jgi:hypothetical protein
MHPFIEEDRRPKYLEKATIEGLHAKYIHWKQLVPYIKKINLGRKTVKEKEQIYCR